MDFRHQISSADALSGLSCDALVLIVTGESVDPTLDAPLASALSDALAQGDLTLRAGKSLYLTGRPACAPRAWCSRWRARRARRRSRRRSPARSTW